ncbi:MAG: PAS domain-containing sensor histidine kinase [Clostridia bacterium]|nr:PAS domain-containing sensor histidine kinase [Clostridia bacterium]
MESMSNIGNLFALSHDPIVCAEDGIITYINLSASKLFGRDLLGSPEYSILPPGVLEIDSSSFVASAKIKDIIVTVTRATYGNLHLYSFILPNENENKTAINAVSASLRDLTNGIKITSDLVNSISEQYGDFRLQQYTAILNQYSSKMKRLVNNYALFSAFKQNAQPFNPIMVSVTKLCHDICKEIEAYSLPRNINFTYTTEDEIIASVDAELLSQMLLNIISNSLTHMPDGGTVHLECTSNINFIKITVTDNGTGISPEILTNVFKSYTIQESTTPEKFTAGLGLSVADGVAKIHGGTLIIDSKVGIGTKVVAHIPKVIESKFMSPKAEYRIPMREIIMTDLSTWLTWEDYLPQNKKEVQ